MTPPAASTLKYRMRARQGAAAAALVGGAGTVVAAIAGRGRLAYRNVALSAAVDTALALVGALAAAVVWGRFQRNRRLHDLLLAYALTVLALSALAFRAIPAIFVSSHSDFVAWTPVAARAVAGALLAATALVPTQEVARPVRARVAVGVVVVPVAVIAVVMAFVAPLLPTPLGAGAQAMLLRHPFVAVVQALVALLFFVAAVGFVRESEREGDEFAGWLAAGSVLAGVAWVNAFTDGPDHTGGLVAEHRRQLGLHIPVGHV